MWVLGDSIVHWAGVRAKATNKPNLRLHVDIAWWGERGLGWEGFRRSIESQVLLSSPPRLILIHLGGNDLVNIKTPTLWDTIKQEIAYLRDAFPEATLVWIDILKRKVWRGAENGLNAIEKKRKRINLIGRKIVQQSGKSDILIPDIDTETNFFCKDGVHLNDVGLEFYLDYIKDVISKHIQ